jgi:hypothetical protein
MHQTATLSLRPEARAAAAPADVIRRLAGGFAATQVLNTTAKLAIADHLATGPCSSTKLARVLDVHPQALYRFMRLLVAMEILRQERDDRFGLSSLGQLLRSDHPESMRDLILYCGEINYPSAQAMAETVETGSPAFERVFGAPFFQYFAQKPEIGRLFNRVMRDLTNERIQAIIAAYDFGCAQTIIDVAGGNGVLLSAVLRARANMTGTLFDTPDVIADARRQYQSSDIIRRLELIAGDIFDDSLPRARDLYLLSNVIHDWNDERAATILRNCRAATKAHSRLLLIEEIMPARVADSSGTVANDFAMLLLTGGKERTEREYRGLLDTAGFQLARCVPLNPKQNENWAILECIPKRVTKQMWSARLREATSRHSKSRSAPQKRRGAPTAGRRPNSEILQQLSGAGKAALLED